MAGYVCPMHPEMVSDKPGKCPRCGGMELVKIKNQKSKIKNRKGHSGHEHHEHGSHSHDMTSPEAAADFLRRFWLVTLLLLPLAIFSLPGMKFLSYGEFSLRRYIEFGLASMIFWLGRVFFQHAWHEIKMRSYGMMTLVSLGVGSGYLFSAVATFVPALEAEFYLEIATLIWVLLFGHFLEARSSSAAGDALAEVAKLLPKQAHLLVRGKVRSVAIDQLKAGDVILVKPGEKVAADGKIVKGEANFNEAHITGESKPVKKSQGDQVVAGAICADGSVEVRLDKVGENSTVGQIKTLISQAAQTKPRVQKLADKASRWLTFTALAIAILALIVWALVVGQTWVFAVTLAITVLVIACPHALGLAIPTVSTIATQLAVKHGLFIKDLSKLEKVKAVNWVVFDKTGTLTRGEFGVVGVESLNSKERRFLVQVAASLEQHSSHVIGEAIVKYAKTNKLSLAKVERFKNLAGKGIRGVVKGKKYWVGNKALMQEVGVWDKAARDLSDQFSRQGTTGVFVAQKDKLLGGLLLADEVKTESKAAIEALHQLGVKVAMITGDNQVVAKAVAKQLKIDTYFANVLPAEKYEKVRQLQKEGVVMMVGDGVNDAPALKQADVGVAVGAGTDVAVEAGDVVLTASNPQDIVSLIVLGKKTYKKMVENLIWATGYNILALPAAAGLFIPWGFRLRPEIGALLMSLSSVIVVINAFRLKRAKLKTS